MRTHLFLYFLFLSLTVTAQNKIDNSDSLIKVGKAHYSLSYPKSWTIDTTKMFGADILLRSPKTDSLDDFRENMNIFVQDLHGQNYTLSKMGHESEKQIRNMVTDVEIIASQIDTTTIPQKYILKYNGRQGKYILTTLQNYYLKDDIGYALTFVFKSDKESEYISVAEKIFNSFEFH